MFQERKLCELAAEPRLCRGRLLRRPAHQLTEQLFVGSRHVRDVEVLRALLRAFGKLPRGMWPAEGSVSPEVAQLLSECGVGWIATDEGVLWNSELDAGVPGAGRERLYRPYRALLESNAAFFAAQMTAMDTATKNSAEMISSLTLFMNKVRQAAITREIIEVVSGAQAL